jgi:hypothetical protein
MKIFPFCRKFILGLQAMYLFSYVVCIFLEKGDGIDRIPFYSFLWLYRTKTARIWNILRRNLKNPVK